MRNPNWSFTMTGASVALPACAPTSWRHGSSRRSLSLARGGGRTRTASGMPAKGWKSPVWGFWYRNQGDGLGDGRGGLQRALSALRDPAAAD